MMNLRKITKWSNMKINTAKGPKGMFCYIFSVLHNFIR